MARVYRAMPRNCIRLATAIAMTLTAATAAAATCSAESGARRVALLELYTSEGCNSCPPADRWVSALPERSYNPERVVTLGFHVDYWNYLGWNDPFARPEYSARQRSASQRNQARFVYTPQLLLNGRDFRRGIFKDDFDDRVTAINRDAPRARIGLKLASGAADALSVNVAVAVTDLTQRMSARVFLALYENDLSSLVTAGENRGKRLRHDFVVRGLAGPHPVDTQGKAQFSHRFKLDSRWKSANLHVVAFVQNEATGDVLQALAIPHCQ